MQTVLEFIPATPEEAWCAEAADRYLARHADNDLPAYLIFPVLAQLHTPEQVVLDVGCGFGRLISVFEELSGEFIIPRYIGVDASERMLENARARYPGYDFRKGSIGSLEDAVPEVVDGFFAILPFALFPASALPAVFSDIRARLHPKAPGLMIFDYGTVDRVVTGEMDPALPRGRFMTFHSVTPEVIEPLLEEAGLVVLGTDRLGENHFGVYVNAM